MLDSLSKNLCATLSAPLGSGLGTMNCFRLDETVILSVAFLLIKLYNDVLYLNFAPWADHKNDCVVWLSIVLWLNFKTK